VLAVELELGASTCGEGVDPAPSGVGEVAVSIPPPPAASVGAEPVCGAAVDSVFAGSGTASGAGEGCAGANAGSTAAAGAGCDSDADGLVLAPVSEVSADGDAVSPAVGAG
jgi:hypothetical protein